MYLRSYRCRTTGGLRQRTSRTGVGANSGMQAFMAVRDLPDVTLDLVPHTCRKNSLQGRQRPRGMTTGLAQ